MCVCLRFFYSYFYFDSLLLIKMSNLSKVNAVKSGFVKAQSDNLPSIDMFMIWELMKVDDRFTAAEIRGAKEAK